MIEEKLSKRIREIPPYLFASLEKKVEEKRKMGMEIINMGIGDPDTPTPEEIVSAMQRAVANPSNHSYPSYEGSFEFRKEVSNWMKKRFGVNINPESEVIALIGSKEGIFHFPFAFIDSGDVALVPDPGYPVYSVSVKFCGGNVFFMRLKEKNGFLPDFSEIPEDILKGAKLLYLNYPNNPTSASADLPFFKEAVRFAKKYGIIILHDAAYSEIYEGSPTPSILQVDGAKEVAVEMHSFSKTFNMTGWRIGFAVGGEPLIGALRKVKTNVDSGVFTAVQEAGIEALKLFDRIVPNIRKLYSERRKIMTSALRNAGLSCFPSTTTFYLWVKVPEGFTSMEFAEKLLEKGLVCTPGIGFGEGGEGYVRFSLTVPDGKVRRAAEILRDVKIGK